MVCNKKELIEDFIEIPVMSMDGLQMTVHKIYFKEDEQQRENRIGRRGRRKLDRT